MEYHNEEYSNYFKDFSYGNISCQLAQYVARFAPIEHSGYVYCASWHNLWHDIILFFCDRLIILFFLILVIIIDL